MFASFEDQNLDEHIARSDAATFLERIAHDSMTPPIVAMSVATLETHGATQDPRSPNHSKNIDGKQGIRKCKCFHTAHWRKTPLEDLTSK